MRRRAPRPVSFALQGLATRLAPATPLAEIQRAWPEVAGPAVSREARPVSERSGTVVLACRSGVWAQELDLMGPELAQRLNGHLGRPAVKAFRCRVDTSRPPA